MASSADLDLSMHSLNKSISKHKFSFPKSERFKHNSTSVYVFQKNSDATLTTKFHKLALNAQPHSAMVTKH